MSFDNCIKLCYQRDKKKTKPTNMLRCPTECLELTEAVMN